MCTIYGSNNLNEFKELYHHNVCKGREGLGVLLLPGTWTVKPPVLKKFLRPPDLNQALSSVVTQDIEFFVGHSQSANPAVPVSRRDLINPFVCGDWVVSHNGRLKNFEALKNEVPSEKFNDSDSSIIPALLEKYQYRSKTEAEDIAKVLAMLEGEGAYWIYNLSSQKLYLASTGLNLFINPVTGSFSTVPVRHMIPVTKFQLLHRVNNPSSPLEGKWDRACEIVPLKKTGQYDHKILFKENQVILPGFTTPRDGNWGMPPSPCPELRPG